MPSAMLSMLQNNVFIFSGFKTHAQLSAVSALLLDDKGKKKPFDTFLQDVKAIDKTYNQTYLRARSTTSPLSLLVLLPSGQITRKTAICSTSSTVPLAMSV